MSTLEANTAREAMRSEVEYLRNVVRLLLPYARSRAEDLHSLGGDKDEHWCRANCVVDMGYRATGETR